MRWTYFILIPSTISYTLNSSMQGNIGFIYTQPCACEPVGGRVGLGVVVAVVWLLLSGAIIVWEIFPSKSLKRHCIACQWWPAMLCHLCVHDMIFVLPLHVPHSMQLISDCVDCWRAGDNTVLCSVINVQSNLCVYDLTIGGHWYWTHHLFIVAWLMRAKKQANHSNYQGYGNGMLLLVFHNLSLYVWKWYTVTCW